MRHCWDWMISEKMRLQPVCTHGFYKENILMQKSHFPTRRSSDLGTSIVYNDKINPMDVHERQLLQVMLAYRLFMPFAGMTISTRERADFRNHVIGLAATKISAGVSTGIGSHTEEEEQGDDQFEIADGRNVEEVVAAIKERGLQPVMNDYVFV